MTSNLTFEARLVFSNPAFACHCTNCHALFTLQFREPAVVDTVPATCPLCSSPLTIVTEEFINQDVFDYIAMDFNLTRETIEGIYELWQPPRDPIRFVEFVKSAIEGKVD